MSSGLRLAKLKQSLAGKWQIPLFVLAAALLVAGLFQLRAAVPGPSFEDERRLIEQLRRRGLYLQASQLIQDALAKPERTAAELAELHRLQADTIYRAERGLAAHNPRNAQRIILHYREACSAGKVLSVEAQRQIAEAWE